MAKSPAASEAEVGKVIVGQHEGRPQHHHLCAGLAGHALLEGVPGLGKTMLIRTLGDVLDLKFSRIQFTPDLMPADIVGTDILEETRKTVAANFVSKPVPFSPIWCWRTKSTAPRPRHSPPRWKRCRRKRLPSPGAVMTCACLSLCWRRKNPLEMEGTYPLPEAQLDRFLFKVDVKFPSVKELIHHPRPHHRHRSAKSRQGGRWGTSARHGPTGAQRAYPDSCKRICRAYHRPPRIPKARKLHRCCAIMPAMAPARGARKP